jgi:hypothetical protein
VNHTISVSSLVGTGAVSLIISEAKRQHTKNIFHVSNIAECEILVCFKEGIGAEEF